MYHLYYNKKSYEKRFLSQNDTKRKISQPSTEQKSRNKWFSTQCRWWLFDIVVFLMGRNKMFRCIYPKQDREALCNILIIIFPKRFYIEAKKLINLCVLKSRRSFSYAANNRSVKTCSVFDFTQRPPRFRLCVILKIQDWFAIRACNSK